MNLFDNGDSTAASGGGESQILSVAIPRPVEGLFTYKLPSHLASLVRVGGCVQVPFGRSVTHAFVVEPPKKLSELSPDLNREKLKDVLEVGDPDLVLPPDVLELCRWAREYYSVPIGEILNCAGSATIFGSQSKKRKSSSQRRRLKDSPSLTEELPKEVQFTAEQTAAFEFLNQCRLLGEPKVALLEGVTGSGKSEIYVALAQRTLEAGRGVLILVPEIALTPQLQRRFEERFKAPIALWHSAVSPGRRREQMVALCSGATRIVIGARSGVFAPIQNLGLVVVDEEHDATYKQEDRVRYHARDLAIVRAKITKALTVLGSATPSLETRERVREGRYVRAALTQRVASGGFPQMSLVDLRSESRIKDIQTPLALKTVEAIQGVLAAGEQVIIYLNRRGYAAFLLCKECGQVKDCPYCSVSLTVHRKNKSLQCHLCGHKESIPEHCTQCQGIDLHAMGPGTESLETEITQLVQGAHVLRLDRDQITSTGRLEKVLEEFRNRSSNVLLGTQMLVKGHDFPGVTLVVVILADALFHWPDFRAHERAYQVLKQVAGRSGRGEKKGKVLVQTFDPDHPVLQVLDGRISEDSFLESERELRQVLRYPPFGRLARLRFERSLRDEAIQQAASVGQYIQQNLGLKGGMEDRKVELLGPSEAMLERVKGVFRWDLIIKADQIGSLQRAVMLARNFCASKKWHLVIDIDPSSS